VFILQTPQSIIIGEAKSLYVRTSNFELREICVPPGGKTLGEIANEFKFHLADHLRPLPCDNIHDYFLIY
jgi:hypothetical protein